MTHDDSHEPEIAVTGNRWMGKGTGSIWTLVREAFSKATNEIQIATYSITESSGEFFDLLDDALARRTRITMIINRFSSQPESVQERLLKLADKYRNLVLRDFNPDDNREDLHAKLIVIDHSTALVGSANLTWKGMVMNHELMIKLSGKSANAIGELLDRLSKSCTPIHSEENID